MNRIASFSVNHDYIKPGIYVSRIDGDITTYDMRTRKPNSGDYMDNLTMHSLEHMLATFIRNGALKSSIIYFGPMGCQTGFYLLVRNAVNADVLSAVIAALNDILHYNGEVFGSRREECGNYLNLSLDSAKKEAERYLSVLSNADNDFSYGKQEK